MSAARPLIVRPRVRRPIHMWPVLCFTAVVVMPVNALLTGTPALLWTLAVAGTVLAGTLILAKRPHLGAISLIGGALVFASTVAIWSTGASGTHWRVGLQLAVYMAFMPWSLRGIFQRSPAALQASVIGLLVGQTVSALAALVQVLGVSVAGRGLVYGRAQGLAGNPNVLGLIAGVTVVLCVYLLLRAAGPRPLLLMSALLNGAALIACGSISALIASALGVLVLLAARRVPLRTPILLTAAGGGVIWLLGRIGGGTGLQSPLDRVRAVTGQSDRVATCLERTDTYATAWREIQKSPFAGRGLDDRSGHLPGLGELLTHNVLLRSWYQGGIGAGLAFLLVYVVLALIIARAVIRGQDAISAGVLTVVMAFSLTSAALHQEYYWMLLGGAWALATPGAKWMLRARGPDQAAPNSVARASITA